jgi:hypothetical protein
MLKVLLTDIHFSHQSIDDSLSNKQIEKVICDYIIISEGTQQKNTLELQPFQYKNMSKSEIENYILIQEISKRRQSSKL